MRRKGSYCKKKEDLCMNTFFLSMDVVEKLFPFGEWTKKRPPPKKANKSQNKKTKKKNQKTKTKLFNE